MTLDPLHTGPGEENANDLFSKLDSLIQKHQESAPTRQSDTVPTLEGPLAQGQSAGATDVPVLRDAVDRARAADQNEAGLLADHRRQLQVALYLRLRRRLDQELDAAVADDLRSGAGTPHPVFARAAQELRSVLPIVVREAVEQVLGRESLEALLGRTPQRGDDES